MKSKLEIENILCFLFDEYIVGLNPLYNVTVGSIKLKISKSDIAKVTEIIEATEKSVLTNDQGEVIKCPKCESEYIYSGFKSMKGKKGILSVWYFRFTIRLFTNAKIVAINLNKNAI